MKKVKKVFVVFKTHFDIGFTHLAKELFEWYSNGMLKGVIDICSATSQLPDGEKYIWTIPSWPLKKTLDGINNNELKDTVEKLIRNKQLVWHGLPFTLHTEFCGLEEFVRGLYIAKGLSDKYGYWPSDAKMTDVPGHTWILPSILAKAGVRFLHLGSNPCVTIPDLPRLFFWEGPDKGRVLTFYSKGEYGSDLTPPTDWDYPYWLAVLQTGDNQGVQESRNLNELFERVRNELPEADFSIGNLEDFGNAILGGDFDIPTIRGDLADTWIKGVGSAPGGVSKIRNQRPVLSTMEAISTIKDIIGLYKSTEDRDSDYKTIAECYEKMLLFCEHTWSMDAKQSILPERHYGAAWDGYKFWQGGTYNKQTFEHLKKYDPGYLRLQESSNEQLEYLKEADHGIKILAGNLEDIAASANFKGGRLAIASSLGRKDIVSVILEGVLPENGKTQYLSEANSDDAIPVYMNHEGIRTADLPIPAIGYRIYKTFQDNTNLGICREISSIASVAGAVGILENRYFRIEANRSTGCLNSFFVKSSGKEWVNNKSQHGFGQYIYDIYGSKELDKYLRDYLSFFTDWSINDFGKAGYPKNQQHLRFTAHGFDLRYENGYNWGKLIMAADIDDESVLKYGNTVRLKITVTAYSDKEYIDICYDLAGKNETPFIESGHFIFPFALDDPMYKVNKLGSVIDPETDVISGCNKDLHCVDKWVDISDGRQGMAIIPLDMPLFSFNEPGVLKFDRDFTIKGPTLMMQAFNNAWGTNFPQWIGGDLIFRYRLMPHKGDWKEGEVWRIAEATIKKPEARYVSERSSDVSAPSSWDLLSEDLDGFAVLTFKPADDKQGYILRISDIKGSARSVTIKIKLALAEVWLCDLVERKHTKLLTSKDDYGVQIQINTEAFEIHTIYMTI